MKGIKPMKEIIFMIEDDPEGGYNAQALGYSIFTEGETTEELKANIMDAVGCHFGGSEYWDEVLRYGG